jgi:hypothetical protein
VLELILKALFLSMKKDFDMSMDAGNYGQAAPTLVKQTI